MANEDPGTTAFAAGDYEKAREIWETDAHMGLPASQYNLGYLYHTGTGVELNYSIAARWYEEAVKADCRAAQCNLGNMYMNGQGVAVDHEKAISLFGSCVKPGGICRENVGNLNKFAEERLAWYAERDYIEAQMLMAGLAQGGGRFDAMAAYLQMAADNGHGPAKVALGSSYLSGDGVVQDREKGADLVFGAMLQHRNEPGTLRQATSTLAFAYYRGAITTQDPDITQYVWGELAFRDTPESDTFSRMMYRPIVDEARARLSDSELNEASRLLEQWQELIDAGLPGVTEEHLRTLRPPGGASASSEGESKGEIRSGDKIYGVEAWLALAGVDLRPPGESVPAISSSDGWEYDDDVLDTKVMIAEVWLSAGYRSLITGNVNEAIMNFNLSIDAFNDAEDFFYESDYFEWDLDYPEDFINPNQRAAAYLGRALAGLAEGDYGAALANSSISQHYQDTAMAHAILAHAHTSMGAKQKAVDAYRAFRNAFPEETEAAREVRDIYFQAFGEHVPEF